MPGDESSSGKTDLSKTTNTKNKNWRFRVTERKLSTLADCKKIH